MAGIDRCPVMTASTPAAMAASKGGSSRRSITVVGAATVGISRWESASVSPWPGKCLAQQTIPAEW